MEQESREEKRRRLEAYSTRHLHLIWETEHRDEFTETDFEIVAEILKARGEKLTPQGDLEPRGEWKCKKCGTRLSEPPLLTNHCPKCKESIGPSRLSSNTTSPRITEPPEVLCFSAQIQTRVVAKSSLTSETLYVIGQGDILPIVGEESDFYQVLLPAEERGYIQKSSGVVIPIGTAEVQQPLGYVRQIDNVSDVPVTVIQPDEKANIVYTLKKEDRLPVVEEREHSYMIQLTNGIRGWVHKAHVIRTLEPTSLPSKETLNWGSALGMAALFGVALIGGALLGDPEEARIRRGVDKALRDRGL